MQDKEASKIFPTSYAAINKNENVRINSSSGGVFYLLAEYVIDLAGVVFGAAFDKKYHLKHIYIEHKKNIKELMGSKYIQSDLGESFEKVAQFIPLYNYIDYTDSMSKNADDLDDLTRRYKEHYLILIKTLKMIEEVQNANLQKEIRRVEIKTTRNIYMAAIKYGNVNLAKENFQKLKKMQVLKMQDRIKYFMVKHYYLRVLLNKMIWRKK